MLWLFYHDPEVGAFSCPRGKAGVPANRQEDTDVASKHGQNAVEAAEARIPFQAREWQHIPKIMIKY